MDRKRVKLGLIANASARRNTMEKSTRGILKKVHKLCMLCDLKACSIMYELHEHHLQAWLLMEAAKEMAENFKGPPDIERFKKVTNHHEFVAELSSKLDVQNLQIKKQIMENQVLKTRVLMHEVLNGGGLHGASMEAATNVVWMAESEMKDLYKKIVIAKENAMKEAE